MRAQILKYTNWIIDCDYKKNLWESFNVVDEVAYRAAVGPLYAYRASLLIT
ncbi:uncharacterized protein PHALS_09413 [Plasmopara halstedii]|uniref:Uncharacterized protein n=1 Tax=Plasmopara halstedii TaxID=4781 RepID=A0A0P1A5K3_PLAHL|nr:uncharacterized protein PHALS_09413 [Plasmopara halstedii]CEG35286.1 hypothetical protein PHALS_09413 [Plasmopara halstedii]|eukprot:XP_024571655.1 hypothetical protein PHALS_09413 [Plasmopara halstedii]